MFNVIRLPTKFSRTIKRFSQKEKSELLDMLIKIWDWESVNIPDSIVWDTIWLIYWEWMNMESKNGNKPKISLIQYDSESVAQVTPSKSDTRVEENIVEYNKIDIVNSDIVIAPKVATLETHIKESFTNEFMQEVKEKYDMTVENFKEESMAFLLYWKEKSPNWKKERWEKEKTFDPKLRFRTWMKNNKKWSNRVIVNSEEDERKKKLAEIEERKKALFNNL